MNERQMLDLLHRRYGQRSHNGGTDSPRYICAEHVRDRAGFFDRGAGRTADFIAVDTWQSSMRNERLAIHGIEVKVTRSDWLREIKDPAKAKEGLRYATHRWLAISDPSIARPEELPPGWGLLCPSGDRGLVAKVQASGLSATERAGPSSLAALLRAIAKTSAERTAQKVIDAQVADAKRARMAEEMREPEDSALFGQEAS